MKFVSDPPIALKVQKMKQRVRWQDPLIAERQIDQTRLHLADGLDDRPEFSFLVIGDSGSGAHGGHNPQRHIAERMASHHKDCRFVMHTGDVVYLVGSREYYSRNFIDPYREMLLGGDKPDRLRYDRLTFSLPFFPVPGNHDYYDLPLLYGILSQAALPLRYLLRSTLDLDVGWHGSEQGDAYARAFLDYLAAIASPTDLAAHLDRHYVVPEQSPSQQRYLCYQPREFTRLPNRYYRYRLSGVDFFALDSNTFNAPLPLLPGKEGELRRQELQDRRVAIERQKQEILTKSLRLNPKSADDAEQIDDLRTRFEHLEETERDIDKQLSPNQDAMTDWEQLEWLQQQLIESWNDDSARGRVVYFHHPPYVTEATKWDQEQTLAIRHRLRQVLDRVATAIGKQIDRRPIVDLVINGHAHCFEYLRTEYTGHADSYVNWIVCGGSGYSLRRQREEGADLTESWRGSERSENQVIARSQLFVGRNGRGSEKRRPYSFVRIDVQDGVPPKFVIRPFVSERYRHQWIDREFPPFEI